MKIKIKILNSQNKIHLPKYMTNGSAGLDIRNGLLKNKILKPNQTTLIPTGLAIYIEDPKITGIILPRSGLGHNNGIILGNSIGVIDSDYQGEIKISLWNRSNINYTIIPNERIAQILFIPIIQVEFLIVQDFEITKRNYHGFGHSGKQ